MRLLPVSEVSWSVSYHDGEYECHKCKQDDYEWLMEERDSLGRLEEHPKWYPI
jgi:hypothetical protein